MLLEVVYTSRAVALKQFYPASPVESNQTVLRLRVFHWKPPCYPPRSARFAEAGSSSEVCFRRSRCLDPNSGEKLGQWFCSVSPTNPSVGYGWGKGPLVVGVGSNNPPYRYFDRRRTGGGVAEGRLAGHWQHRLRHIHQERAPEQPGWQVRHDEHGRPSDLGGLTGPIPRKRGPGEGGLPPCIPGQWHRPSRSDPRAGGERD